MKIINLFLILYLIFNTSTSFANNIEFENWVKNFKLYALKKGISQKTLDIVLDDASYLPKVIEYDRFQPEFYEDTITYVSKRASNKKLNKGINLYNKNKKLINQVDEEFKVEKELLIALMGIETNYGKYLGKMDIISSLSTLSFDKRRSEFFTRELITLLQLVENNIIDHNLMYGSWAGAYGNFQFMPSTIKNYAIDKDKDDQINLISIKDSFASAANYLSKIGWKKNNPCFVEINLSENTPNYLLNTSAKKIKNKKKLKYFKKYIKNYENISINKNLITAIITPDKDIIPDSSNYDPAYLVFDNYELILKWNRSLRFALAVCTLKNKFENEL